MSPYILLTSTPYSFNSGELGGIAAYGFIQTAPTVAQTIQAAGNTTGLIVEQNAGGTYGNDIFDVQGTGGASDNFLQVTSSAANTGNVTLQGLGSSSTVGIQAGSGGTLTIGNQSASTANTINLGSTTTNANADTVNINTESANTGTVNIGGTGNATGTITIGQSTGTNTVSIGGGATVNTSTQTVNIGNGVTASGGTLAVNIGTQGASGSTTTIKVGSIQTADTVTLQAGATSEAIANGGAAIQTSTNSLTAFQVQNADGESILQGGTLSPTNYILDASFVNGSGTTLTDWTKLGSPSTYTQNTTSADTYDGQDSLEEVFAAASEGFETPGSGAGLTSEPTTNNGADEYYTVSFEAFQIVGTAAANTFTVTAVDSSGNQTCTGQIGGSGTATLTGNGFEQVYCTLQFTSGTAGAISQIEVTNSSTSGTFFFDAAQLQLATSASTSALPSAYQEGTLALRGLVVNPVALQNATNSRSAFQVQNSSGLDVFNVDTVTNDTNAVLVSGTTTAGNTQNGILGQSNSGVGVQGYSGSGYAIQGNSYSGTSGYFQSANGSNGDTTLITQLASGQSSNIFQAETSTGGNLLSVAANGDTAVTSSDTTGNALSVTANSISSGNGENDSFNGLTSGNGVNLATTSTLQTAGSLLNVSNTATLTTSGGNDAASLINVSRAITANISGGSSSTVTLDTTGTGAESLNEGVGDTSWSNNYTVGSHSNMFLLVQLAYAGGTCGTNKVASITYNSTPLSLMTTNVATTDECVAFYGLVNPTQGSSKALVVTTTGQALFMTENITAWYNVNQTTPYNTTGGGAFTTNSGTASTASLTASSASGQTVVDVLVDYTTATTTPATNTSGQTRLSYINDTAANLIQFADSYKSATTSTTSMGWTTLGNVSGAYAWTEASIGLNPVLTVVSENVTAPVATFSNSCTTSSGGSSVCSDATNILDLNQQYTGATGAVLAIQNSGLGDMLDLDNGSSTILDRFSSTGSLTIGQSGGSLTPALLTLGTGTYTNDPTSVTNGAIYYNSSMNSFRCGQNGGWIACDGDAFNSFGTSAGIGVARRGNANGSWQSVLSAPE